MTAQLRQWAALVAALILVAGCAGAPEFKPVNEQEVLSRVYVEISSVAEATALAQESGSLTAETAQNVKENLQIAQDAADAAGVALAAGDLTTYHGRLSLAQSLLTLLRSQLPEAQ